MSCRLCNRKIPLLRSWFTVAEFCCDEHEKEFKELALNRLVADAAAFAGEGLPKPREIEDPEPEAAVGPNEQDLEETPAPDEPAATVASAGASDTAYDLPLTTALSPSICTLNFRPSSDSV